jgi:hypothetical protein
MKRQLIDLVRSMASSLGVRVNKSMDEVIKEAKPMQEKKIGDVVISTAEEITGIPSNPAEGVDMRKFTYVHGKEIRISLGSLVMLLASLTGDKEHVEMCYMKDNKIFIHLCGCASHGNLVYDLKRSIATCLSNGWIFFLESEYDRAILKKRQEQQAELENLYPGYD